MASTTDNNSGVFQKDQSQDRARGKRPIRDAQVWLNELDSILNDDAGTDINALKIRLRNQLETARNALGEAADTAADTANSYVRDAVDCVDIYVETRPWHAIAYAAGTAFLLGIIVARR